MPGEKRARRHALAAGTLQLREPKRAVAAGHDDVRTIGPDDAAWQTEASGERDGLPDLERCAVEARMGAGRRVESAHDAIDRRRIRAPVDDRFTTLDLRSIRSRRWILRLGLDRLAAVKARKRLDNRVGSEDGELRAQAPGRLPGFDRQAVPGDDRSGIESLIHAHDRDAGLGVTGQERA